MSLSSLQSSRGLWGTGVRSPSLPACRTLASQWRRATQQLCAPGRSSAPVQLASARASCSARCEFADNIRAMSRNTYGDTPWTGPRAFPWSAARGLVPAPCLQAQARAVATRAALAEGQGKASTGLKGKQTVDLTTLSACCAEVNSEWVPSKVESILMPDAHTLVLALRTLEGTGHLYVCWHQTAARVSVGGYPDRGSASENYSLAEQATKQLRGLVLLGAEMPQQWDRVITLKFGTRPGEPASRHVHVEIMGRYSNVVITDENEKILTLAHQVGGKQSSLRQVQAGGTYAPPPPQGGLLPDVDEDLATWQSNVTQAAAAMAERRGPKARPETSAGLVRAYQGVGPSLAAELCISAGIVPQMPPADMNDSEWCALHECWQNWLKTLSSGEFKPTICSETGRLSVLGSYDTEDEDGSILRAVGRMYDGAQREDEYSAKKASLVRAVGTALKKAVGKLKVLQKQADDAEAADQWQKKGDLIMGNVYRIEAGAREVEVEDWDTGEKLTLPLEVGKTAVEVAEGMYKKARKLRGAGEKMGPLMEETEARVAYLEEVEVTLSQLGEYEGEGDLLVLGEIVDELVSQKVIPPPPDAAQAQKANAKARKRARKQGGSGGGAGTPFRKYQSPNGFTVLIGRNNRQNDELSMRVGKAGDVWMHARGIPGSHLIIQVPAGREPAEEDIQFAADLSVFYSKARESGRCDVAVADAGDVKKPKGAPPGSVMLLKESVVRGFPDNANVETDSW